MSERTRRLAAAAAALVAVLVAVDARGQTPETDPGSLAGEMERCLALVREGRHDAARERLAPIVAAHPGWQRATFFLGLTYYEQERHGEARPWLERAIAIDPDSADATRARVFYGWTLYYLGEADAARRQFERFVAAEPGVADAHFALGLLAFDRDDLDEARARYGTAIELARRAGDERTEGKARARLADVELRTGRLPQARAQLEAAVKLRPDAYEAYFKLSRVLQRLGDDAGATRARAAGIEARESAEREDGP